MLTMAFLSWKQSKKPSPFINNFKTSLIEEDSVLNSISPEIRRTKTTSALGSSDSFVKTLRMEYNSNQDWNCNSSTELSIEESLTTKREVLSDSAKIFDSLGLISCVTIVAKIISQRLWERGTAWDEPLPTRHSERVAKLENTTPWKLKHPHSTLLHTSQQYDCRPSINRFFGCQREDLPWCCDTAGGV